MLGRTRRCLSLCLFCNKDDLSAVSSPSSSEGDVNENNDTDTSSHTVEITFNKGTFTLGNNNFHGEDTVQTIKEKIRERTGFPVHQQRLQHKFPGESSPYGRDTELRNDQKISSFSKDYVVWLNLTLADSKDHDQIKLIVNTLLTGGTNELYANRFETIGNIKKQIKFLLKKTLNRIDRYYSSSLDLNGFFIFGGNVLSINDQLSHTSNCRLFNGRDELVNDSKTLSDYKIGNESSISLIRNNFVHSELPPPSESDIGCSISKPELRGITIRQLVDIIVEIKTRCEVERWKNRDGELLKPENVNLYDLVKHFVKPKTEERKCSYVEIVAKEEQKPKWFVSHWWGESVFNFVNCIIQHAYDRGLDDDTSYWICAYAVNQHDVGGDLGDSPKDSPFYKAMTLSEGTVSILDEQNESYRRIWCGYEVYLSIVKFASDNLIEDVGKNTHLYDVYTVAKKFGTIFSIGHTEGFTTSDKYGMWYNDGINQREMDRKFWMYRKTNREKLFPLGLGREALRVELENAESTIPNDKKRILNSIIGNNLNDDPPAEHPKYREVNRLLRSKFAVALYRQVLENAEDDMPKYRTALLEAQLQKLSMSFRDCADFAQEAEHFFNSIPATLEKIDFDLYRVKFRSSTNIVKGIRRLTELTSMKFDCNNCGITDEIMSKFVDEVSSIEKLQELSLDFSRNKISSLCGLFKWIASNPVLSSLKLRVEYCDKLSTLDSSGLQFRTAMEKLTTLDLDCCSCEILNDINVLSELVSSSPTLSYLKLRFNYCDKLSWLDSSEIQFRTMEKLTTLDLSFGGCKALADTTVLSALVLSSPALSSLKLCLDDCEKLSSLDNLAEGFRAMEKITSLNLHIAGCKALGDTTVLNLMKAIVELTSLEKIALIFRGSCSKSLSTNLIVTNRRELISVINEYDG